MCRKSTGYAKTGGKGKVLLEYIQGNQLIWPNMQEKHYTYILGGDGVNGEKSEEARKGRYGHCKYFADYITCREHSRRYVL